MQLRNVRFIIAAITTLSAYSVYVSRVNLSIAIIAMVDDGHSNGPAHNDSATIIGQQQLLASHPANTGISNNNITSPWPQTADQLTNRTSGMQLNSTSGSHQRDKLLREPLTTIFPASKKTVKTPLMHQEKFHWDQTEQGHILGAFFYGYILFQIPGARMAESVGAKWIIMAANAGSALISLLFPLSTQMNSIHLLMVLRFVMGLCQSAFFPAAYVLFCRWLPERERSILLPIMFIGSNMGSISTYILSSYLITASNGWPSVFYYSGAICGLVTLLWCIFGSNGPEDNWLITDEERIYIEGNVCNQTSERNSFSNEQQQQEQMAPPEHDQSTGGSRRGSIRERRGSLMANVALAIPVDKRLEQQVVAPISIKNNGDAIRLESRILAKGGDDLLRDSNHQKLDNSSVIGGPEQVIGRLSWTKLMKSIPVWTLIWSMYGNEWSNAVLCYELPTYLNTALNIPIEQNGVINSFFQLSYTLVSPVMSSLGAYMLDRHICGMRKIHVRKLFQSLALFGQLVCFVSVPICGSNRGLIIMFMFSAIVFKSCANAGDIMVSGDLSPEYAGTIFAFANSVGNTAGFFVPLLAGSFINDAHDRDQWTPFWLTTAAIMGASGLIFLIFGQTKRQDFSKDAKSVFDGEHDHDNVTLDQLGKLRGTKTAGDLPQCCQSLV